MEEKTGILSRLAFFKKKKFLILIPIIAIGAYFLLFKKEDGSVYTLAKVERGSIKQTVSETGTVEASDDLNLSFLISGRLAKVHVREGERAQKDQVLAELDYGALSIKEKEAQSQVMAANANLDKLIVGATGAEIKVARANVSQAKAAYDASVRDLEKTKNTVEETSRQAQKKMDDLLNSTEKDITTYEQAVTQANTALANAKTTYQTALETAKTNALADAEDSILDGQIALDKIKTILDDADAMVLFSQKDISYVQKTKDGHSSAITKKIIAENSYSQAKVSRTDIAVKSALIGALNFLNATLSALNYSFQGLEKSITSFDFSQAELDAYKTAISAQITLITASIAATQSATQGLDTAILNYDAKVRDAEESLIQAKASLDSAKLTAQNSLESARLSGDQQAAAAESKAETSLKALDAAEAGLDKVLVGSNNFDVRSAQAALSQAEANLASVKRQIEDSIIKAPVSGIVAKINFDIGETVQAASPAITIIGDNIFNIKIDISEIDVPKINLGNEAEITFDAFGPEKKYKGEVYFVDTAPTIIQDVVYYEVKVRLDGGMDVTADATGISTDDSLLNNNADNVAVGTSTEPVANPQFSGIKPGMTANVDIFAVKKDDVLIMPLRAVVDKNGSGKFVRIMSGGAPKEAPIEIGLKGDEGMVEVVSGVKEGDEVVTFIKENKK